METSQSTTANVLELHRITYLSDHPNHHRQVLRRQLPMISARVTRQERVLFAKTSIYDNVRALYSNNTL